MSNKNLKNSEDKMSKNSEEQQLYVNKSAEKRENKAESVSKSNKNSGRTNNSCK